MNALKKSLGLGAIYVGLRKTANIVKDVAQANIDMIETNNLFEVSMGKVVDQYGNLDEEASKYYTKAMNFQNEMNEKLATNKSELQQYQAMYYSMFKGQGIDKNNSYTMSESLTKAGYDIASLYNLSVEDAMNKIKSGIAGQVESLRTIGIDVSESALTKVIRNAGIDDRSVQQLSYAEKEVARYIAILNQAGQAQGDFAKTFESPANQLRVFQNQLIELKQVAGSFIVNAFGGIIVWANAIIMAIKEIIKSIASLFGYDLNSGGSSNLADSVGISDLNSGLGSATKKAKELKKQLMGFDEINNIDPASTSGSSGSGGVATGIDDKLLNSLKEWDNKMSSISGKAQEIRDKMLEWLGFERNDDGTWKLKEGYTNIKKIRDIAIAIGTAILGWKLAGFILDLKDAIKKAGSLSELVKGLKTKAGLAIGITSLYFYLEGYVGIKNGKVTSETVIKSIAGALGVGVASAIMGLSIPLSATISLGLIGITFQAIGEQTTAGSLTKLVREELGIDKDGTLQIIVNQFAFTVEAFKFLGLEDLIKKAIKNIIYSIADFVEKIPIIGENLSAAIRAGVTATEKDTTEHIENSVNSSIKTAQDSINTTSETSGMQTMLKYKQGISNQQTNLNNAVKDAQNNSLVNARETVNSTSQASGMQAMLNYKQGISSKQGDIDKVTKDTQNNSLVKARGTINNTSETSGRQMGNSIARGISSQQTNVDNATSRVGNSANTKFRTSLGSADSSARNFLLGFSRVLSSGGISGPVGIFSSIATLTGKIIARFNSGLGNHSPSKKTRQSALFFAQGFTNQIKKSSLEMISQAGNLATDLTNNFSNNIGIVDTMKELNQGIKVNTKDMAIDTTQYVNYGAISGQIQAQSKISIGNISDRIYNAVVSGMEKARVQVDINAKTDEGVIVEKASEGFRDIVNRTGELPFPVPV